MITQGTVLSLVIRRDSEKMIVSVFPKVPGVKDSATGNLVPLVVSGTPEELDEGFLDIVAKPVGRVCGLLSNIEDFEKAEQKTAAESRMLKEQKEKEAKAEKARKEKFEALISKADEKASKGLHAEAVSLLEQALETAGEKDIQKVRDRIAAEKDAMGIGSLFGADDVDNATKHITCDPGGQADCDDDLDDLPE